MKPRYYRNLAALSTRAEVIAECDRLRALAHAGYYAQDGWRVCVEIPPDVAMEQSAEHARKLERQAAKVRAYAEGCR